MRALCVSFPTNVKYAFWFCRKVAFSSVWQSVSHYSISGGPYARAYVKLAAQGFQLHWQSAPVDKQGKAKKSSKTKFTCPECGQNAWAKPDALLLCGECYEEGQRTICLLVAEPAPCFFVWYDTLSQPLSLPLNLRKALARCRLTLWSTACRACLRLTIACSGVATCCVLRNRP